MPRGKFLHDLAIPLAGKPVPFINENGQPYLGAVAGRMESTQSEVNSTQSTRSKERIYKIFPHAICKARNIKRTLLRLKKNNVVYAESTRNTKINFVRTRKTITPTLERGNTILTSKCICGKHYKITATKFNETGKMAWENRIKTTFTGCKNTQHAFRKVKVVRGMYYENQTQQLANYIKWKYRGKVINTKYTIPNYHFAKLLIEVSKPLK